MALTLPSNVGPPIIGLDDDETITPPRSGAVVSEPVRGSNGLIVPANVGGPIDAPQPLPSEAVYVNDPSAVNMAQVIVDQQNAGRFPQGARPDVEIGNNVWDSLKTLATGADRETPATMNLPSLADVGVANFIGEEAYSGAGGNAVAALLTATNPVERVRILTELSGGTVQVRPDEAGNMILSNPTTGAEVIENMPGMGAQEWMQLGAIGAAFTPGLEKVQQGKTLIRQTGRMMGQSGAVQTGLELQQATAGGEVNPLDIGLAAGTGGISQVLLGGASRIIPALREQGIMVNANAITAEVREQFTALLQKVGIADDDINDELIKRTIQASDNNANVTPTEAVGIAGETEFGVPLTTGERNFNSRNLRMESDARDGNMGKAAEKEIVEFGEVQQKQGAVAAQVIRDQIAPGTESPTVAAVVREQTQIAEQSARNLVDDAYETVGDMQLKPEGFQSVMQSVSRVGRLLDVDETLPETAKLLAGSREYIKAANRMEAAGMNLRPTDIKRLEVLRRRILKAGKSAAANTADADQVKLIRQAFDDSIDLAITKSLFLGDDASIAALKDSRALFSEYATRFYKNPTKSKSGRVTDNDEPGKLVETIVSLNPSDEQIINGVFSSSGINKASGSAIIERFASILGRESEGFNAIRRAGLDRIFVFKNEPKVGQVLNPTLSLTAFNNAMEKSGSLMRSLYSKEELETVKRYLNHMARTVAAPKKSRANPAGTAGKLARMGAMLLARFGIIAADPSLLSTVVAATVTMPTKGTVRSMKPFAVAPPLKVGISRADVKSRNVGGAMGAVANTTAIGGAQSAKGDASL